MSSLGLSEKIRRSGISRIVVGIVGFVVSVLFLGPLESRDDVRAAEVQEQRYLFDEDLNWLTPAKREKLLAETKAAGFNVIVPVVWRGIGSTWPSRLVPMDSSWKGLPGASADPIKDLIARAHELGIKVVPWLTVVNRQREFFPEFHEDGTPDHAFNIHEEGFRKFIVKLMMEVVDRYDVDGINLDYVRAKGICKTPACRAKYEGKTTRNLLRDAENMWKDKDSGDAIAEWNAEAVTKVIEEFSKQAKARRPNLPISVDSHPVGKYTYLEGANSIAWANRGLIDMIFDMQYKQEINVTSVTNAKSKLSDPAKYVLLVGNYETAPTDKQRVWARDAPLVAELLKKSRLYSQEAGAVALYEYRFLNDEQIRAIKRGPFSDPDKAE